MMPADFRALTKAQYYEQLTLGVGRMKDGDRVAVVTMDCQPDEPGVAGVLAALEAAARRGVHVRLLVDAFPLLVGRHSFPGPLVFNTNTERTFYGSADRVIKALHRLRAAGGRARLMNAPERLLLNPFSGRTHIKFAVVGDDTYVGGCNLDSVDQIDTMIQWRDAHSADWLTDFADSMLDTGNVRAMLGGHDLVRLVAPGATLLVDSGRRDQSVIMENALKLIDDAQEYLYITCQYFPVGPASRQLAAAVKRGVKVTIVYNHPSQHPLPQRIGHYAVVMREKWRLPASFFTEAILPPRNYLHAKVLTSERSTMVGSHNYVHVGVQFGTAEIALLFDSPAIGREEITAIDKQRA